MRPRYERSWDLAAESIVLGEICRKWGCTSQKLPVRYKLDYLLLREGKGVAWLELKARTNARLAYPTYMISMGKVISAKELTGASGLPSFLLVQWKDELGYARLDSLSNFSVSVGGRVDRGDDDDIEPVALIPVDDFHLVA